MNDELKGSYQQDTQQLSNLEKTVETLRERFLKVRVETSVDEGDTALNVRFLGSGEDLLARQVLVSNMAHYLPEALSVIGISTDAKPGGQKDIDSHQAS